MEKETPASPITIISPINTTYSNKSIFLNVTTNNTTNVTFSLNGGNNQSLYKLTTSGNTTITGIEGANNITVYANDLAGNLSSGIVYFTINTKPPASISYLHLGSHSHTYINWSWTNPVDADFNYTMVYIDGIFQANISFPINYYNATDLSPETDYNISTHTADFYGNINSSWINNTVRSTYSNLKIRGWGWNNNGQVGDGTTTDRNKPVDISDLSDIISIAGGGEHTVVLRKDGTIWAWGYNNYGQLGEGTESRISEPILIKKIDHVKNISAGGYNTLALKSDGTVWSWGYNYFGQLGDGTVNNRTTPMQVNGISGVIEIASGGYHSIAIKSDGTVWGWGSNDEGQLGDGTTINRLIPTSANGISNVKAIAAGKSHTIALKTDGTVWAWGNNQYGQLGDGTTVKRTSAVKVTGISNATAVAAGTFHSIALMSNGTVFIWGDNSMGQLGDGTKESKIVPGRVNRIGDITAISAGHGHSLALGNNGLLWAWGYNKFGQLGDNSTQDRDSPYLLNESCNIVGISGGWFHTIAIYGDLTPPASITNISNTTYALNYINWTWINPDNIDFSKVIIYLSGSLDTNITSQLNYYNWTGLRPDTKYTISIQTVDIYGNINNTLVNHTARTAADTTPPASITNLTNNTYEINYINWTWDNPVDIDFSTIIVYINGTFEANISSSFNFYNATGLTPDTNYTISINTADIYGNINATWVNHSARTAKIIIKKDGFPAITGFAPISPINDYHSVLRIFNITTNTTVNVTWYLNNTKVQTNESVLDAFYANNNQSSGTWIVTAIANNSFGTVSLEWIWSVQSNYQGGSGGGGGGGASGENYSNIEVTEKHFLEIYKDKVTLYSFINNSNPIVFVNIIGYENFGDVTINVEVLRDISSMVKADPPGIIYKNVNIWAGTTSFNSPTKIKSGTIRFRVLNKWIKENNISIVRMAKWNKINWEYIETNEFSKDDLFTYYDAFTQVFSNFAITGTEKLNENKILKGTENVTVKGTEIPEIISVTLDEPEPAQSATPVIEPIEPAETTKNVPGFGYILIILCLCGVYIFRRGRK